METRDTVSRLYAAAMFIEVQYAVQHTGGAVGRPVLYQANMKS